MIIENNGKLNFIIGIHSSIDEDMTGGTLVLHKLAYDLAVYDYNVYIFTKPLYEHKNIKIIPGQFYYNDGNTISSWENFTFPLNNTIAIYPQITIGNPFNCKYVVRWILYHTKEEIEKTYGIDDVYFNFGNFKTFRKTEKKQLTTFDYNFDKLFQTNLNKREGFCHLLHKNTPPNAEEILKYFNSTNINDFEKTKRFDFDYLRDKLNSFEYFLTFDKKSYYTLAAVLCGCKAIILDRENKTEFYENAFTKSEEYYELLTPTEYRMENPIQMFGVAYGIEDISWANKTISLAREHLSELEKIDKKTIKKFIEFWEKIKI